MSNTSKIASTKPPKPQQAEQNRIKIFCFVTLLIAISAFMISLKLSHTQSQQATHLVQTVEMLTQQQSSTAARLQAQQAVALRHYEVSQKQHQKLNQEIQAINAKCQHVSDDWRLHKARYLLELAQANSYWSSDNQTTLAMLEAADAVLAPLYHTKLIAVREALAEDIHQQKQAFIGDAAHHQTQTTSLMVRLNTLEKNTWSLAVAPLPKEEAITKTLATHEDSDSADTTTAFNQYSWDKLKAQFKQALSHVLTIQYHEETLSPTPTLAYEAMVRATVRLNLEEAKWAVLEHNTKIYQQAIQQAIFYLNQSFSTQVASTQAILQELEALEKITLVAPHIVPENALKQLNQAIASQQAGQTPIASVQNATVQDTTAKEDHHD